MTVFCGNGDCEISENENNCAFDCQIASSNENCAKQGEEARSRGCCLGLAKTVNRWSYDKITNGCTSLSDEQIICIKCGDGACKDGETPCNCPDDCGNSNNCANQGESLGLFGKSGRACCKGLKMVADMWDYQNGQCTVIKMAGYFCSNCGNGICENPENICNCAKDCD
ncbi:MAG: hypothetical protein MUD10_01770 [Candidatus Pacebacteria bacterium]|nr:hypothetical protein [Candidatus Paceibacterota bacterium]